jgi:hypothetical protein
LTATFGYFTLYQIQIGLGVSKRQFVIRGAADRKPHQVARQPGSIELVHYGVKAVGPFRVSGPQIMPLDTCIRS